MSKYNTLFGQMRGMGPSVTQLTQMIFSCPWELEISLVPSDHLTWNVVIRGIDPEIGRIFTGRDCNDRSEAVEAARELLFDHVLKPFPYSGPFPDSDEIMTKSIAERIIQLLGLINVVRTSELVSPILPTE